MTLCLCHKCRGRGPQSLQTMLPKQPPWALCFRIHPSQIHSLWPWQNMAHKTVFVSVRVFQNIYTVPTWLSKNLQPFSWTLPSFPLPKVGPILSDSPSLSGKASSCSTLHSVHPIIQQLRSQLMVFFKLGHLTEKVSMNTCLISKAFSFLYSRGCSSHIDKWKRRDSGVKKWLEVLILN